MENKSQQAERIRELTEKLNEAARVYYQGKDERMSNLEYDKLYDELSALERKTGIVLSSSPTQNVGYEVQSALKKERHPAPMLSLDKTKNVSALAEFLGEKEGLLSWKLDGLTVVLSYENGSLNKAVTRGNGLVGEIITANARTFKNIPLKIPFKKPLVLRGEAVIPYSAFARINGTLPANEQYKNPRNLCSGAVRQLDSKVTAKRDVFFYAFSLVGAPGVDFGNSRENQFLFLKKQGFDVVEFERVNAQNITDAVSGFAKKITANDIPSDGLVLLLDDIAYGEALGVTAKFPRNAIAYKWKDETAQTTLRKLEWSASRTGLINPIAVFDPVELEGTTVSRASVHNVSITEELALGIGDTIEVYKANMIIPQIAQNLTRSGNITVPEVCPVCKEKTVLQKENGVKVLLCPNKNCLAKKIKSICLFVSRDALNIDGLSEATIERLMEEGFLHSLGDLFRIDRHRNEIAQMEGFGEKSCENLLAAVDRAKKTTPARFLYGLGIPHIGPANAKLICDSFDGDFSRLRAATADELLAIDGIGQVMADSFVRFFADAENNRMIDDLLCVITWEGESRQAESPLNGLNFVITGSLSFFANRNELKERIEAGGGKVSGGVSKNTNYLINNDSTSNSTKNKKAKELGIPILTEDAFLLRFGKEWFDAD